MSSSEEAATGGGAETVTGGSTKGGGDEGAVSSDPEGGTGDGCASGFSCASATAAPSNSSVNSAPLIMASTSTPSSEPARHRQESARHVGRGSPDFGAGTQTVLPRLPEIRPDGQSP